MGHPLLRLGPDREIALVHPGRAERWLRLEDGRFAWHDGEHLFVEDGREVVVVPSPEDELQLFPNEGGCLAVGAGVEVRVQGQGDALTLTRGTPHLRLGERDAIRAGGAWSIDGLDLSLGAQRARDLRPFPVGVGAVWTSDGYLYRLSARGLAAVGSAGRWLLGPHGALLVDGDDGWMAGAPPDRPVAPLPCPIGGIVAFAPDGAAVRGMDPDGQAVEIDLRTLQIVARREGLPLSQGWLTPEGELRVGGEVLRSGLREASWASREGRLAGPGGRIWDLERGAQVGSGTVELGATVATRAGFATAHWETGRGRHLDPDGQVLDRFQLPLDEDDVVVEATTEGGLAVFVTALGLAWRVDVAQVTAVPCPDVPEPAEPSDAWPLPVEAETADGRWAWTTAGLLLRRT